MSRTACIVGLGTIARTHLEVLAGRPDIEVVCGVDPAPGVTYPFPVHPSVEAALDAHGPPGLVVVATPTDLHTEVVDSVLASTGALVLSEKPLSRRTADLDLLVTRHGRDVLSRRVRVAHHFAFSPEVLWAAGLVAAHPEWGAPTSVVSVFNDPYARRPPEALRSYVTSWVDSGPNQLSMLCRFVTGWRVLGQTTDGAGHRSVTTLVYDGGRATLVTNWVAGDSSKQTTLTFAGGVELHLDHTAMTGLVVAGGAVVEHQGYAGSLSRKVAHYRGLYNDVLADHPSRFSSFGLAAEITGLLEAGTAGTAGTAGAGGELRWSSTGSTESGSTESGSTESGSTEE